METKNIIIIGVLLVIICIFVGAIFGTLTNSVNYERIEIVPNGTSIEIPTNDAKYLGDQNGVRFWNWNNGALVTYNSQEGSNANELSGALGFYAIKELVRNGNSENIDGIDVYQLNGDQLSNLNVTVNGDVFYCIHLVNDTTHDNIVICCKDKDVALHMAKSIEYKISNSTNGSSNNSNANATSSGSSNGLIPVTMDDGSVIYCHAGEYIDRPDGIYRVNSDGSLTKVADDSESYVDDDYDEDYDYDDDSPDSGSSSGSSSSGSGSSSESGSSSGSGSTDSGSVETSVDD